MFYGNCPYWDCTNRNEMGYCKTTTCINPKYQSNTFHTSATTTKQNNQVYFTDYTEEGGGEEC